MSASKNKKLRDPQNAGLNKREAAEAQAAKASRSFRIKVIVTVVVILVLIAAAAFITSDYFYTRTTAVQIGSTVYSPAEVNYFYRGTYTQVYNTLYSQFGNYLSMVFDPNKPLSEQQYDDNQTWAEYIYDAAIADLKRVTVFYDKAIAEGYTLSAEDQAAVETNLADVRSYAEEGNYPSMDAFLAAYYGKGMNEETFVSLLEKSLIAANYSDNLTASFTYTADELSAYYAENAADMNYYNFYVYGVSTTSAAFEALDDTAKAEAAHKAAETIAASGNGDAFRAAVSDFIGSKSTVSMTHTISSGMSDIYKAWITDAARQPGDSTVIDADGMSYALLFDSVDDNNYNTVNMRHILIKAEADENGEYTDEALAAAKARIEEIYAEWKANPTEDNLAGLAVQYSEDGGSAQNGGLYENISKNVMVDEINNFLFNSGARPGEATVAYGESSQYTGYHLVYFAGENGRYCDTLAEAALRDADYTAAYDALAADYTVTEGSGKRFIAEI